MLLNKFNLSGLKLNNHHWGNKKIPIKSIIALINNKPNQDFQYVKILTISELVGYIQYFNTSLSINEIKSIADLFIALNKRKI